ncbi:MAG: DEAD/DEAH box helicase family protein [Deltaproteobacteria bacterium]|nr:DEAD/DEAH box helicase family protein [Deltaproteobacteria bacterium]
MSFFTFSADLPHQLAAVNNVAELFEGLEKRTAASFLNVEDIICNADEWDDLADDLIEENLHRIQNAHNTEQPEASVVVGRFTRDDGVMLDGVSVDAHSCPHFTIEMETGTGKTYVYLRTMLELHRRYGFTKFIVVVPSIGILEGVKKAFDDMRDHFKALFGTTNFARRVYDGGKAGIVPAFARDVFPSLLIMTLQSFSRASNNLYKANDSVISELKPYQWIQRTRPIVILDEPQNMGSEKSKEAIRTLRPLFVLRYSATHKKDDQPNPVYRLTPVQSFRLGLVKHVQVTGIAELGITGKSTLRLLDVTRSGAKPIAKVRALCLEKNNETRAKELTFKQGESIFKQTKLPEHAGLKVSNIRAAGEGLPAAIEFDGGGDGGRMLTTEDDLQGSSEQAWKLQIEESIKSHFARQRELKKYGVKVLSLFFIDRVANYAGDTPRIKNLFDECFNALKNREPDFKQFDAEEVREAYFAKRTKSKKGGGEVEEFLDEVGEDSKEAKEAFELIMRKKEVLLSFPNEKDPGSKVAFIFAHSALREGWDNPNVFQICTLNQTVSVMKKRQEIGRGLRLCVNQKGERLTDPAFNVLTVIANESYENYVRTLQTEYREAGDQAPPAPTRPGKATAKRRDALAQNLAFKQFWDKLCQRLEYTIDIDSDALIKEATAKLNDPAATPFPKPMLAVTKGRFVVVEYTLEFVKALGNDRAQLRLRELSSDGEELILGSVPVSERLVNVAVDTDLVKDTNNPHLRGFRVMEIGRHLGEMRVRFTNEVTISESETHHFSGTRLDNNPTREVAAARLDQPIPDFFGRAAEETFLTRATLWKIFHSVSKEQKETLHAHPEGWANTFVRAVGDVVKDHIVDRLRFRDTGRRDDDIGPIELAFPAEQDQVQRELIDGGPTSLYDKVQVDSDVERTFVNEHLRPDENNLVVYFKFPPRFRIGLPRIIGNYNPDWGVLRHEPGAPVLLELVRETKGGDDLDKLRFLNEGRKLVLAERYFATLGIDYRFVSPQVDKYWQSRGAATHQKKFAVSKEPTVIAVVVYDLRAAATAFSHGQDPEQLGHVYLEPRKAKRPGLFVAKVVGNSMNRVAPHGAWCLWQHMDATGVPAAASGEYVIVRREDPDDANFGGFTFKRWERTEAGARLSPVSKDKKFKPILLTPDDEATTKHIARFIEVLPIDDSEVAA